MVVADVTGKAIGFLIMPYLANRMGPAEFGLLNLYLPITQMLIIFISLGGPALVTIEYVRNGYTSARRMRATSLRLSLWVSIVLLLVSLTISWTAPSIVPLASGVLIVAVSFSQALNMLELSYYRGAQIYSWAVAGQFAFALLSVLLTVLIFEFHSATATNRLLSIALAGGVVQTAYALELRRKHFDPADRATRRSNISASFGFGLSLFIHQASSWIRVSADRFIVTSYFGLAATGVYTVASNLAFVVSLGFLSVSQQLQPFLYRRLRTRDFSGFQRIQAWFVVLVLGFTAAYLGVVLVSFNFLFDQQYDEAKVLLPALLGATAANAIYFLFSHAPFYDRHGGQISSVTAGSLIFYLLGFGLLAFFDRVTPPHIALVFFGSSVVGMLGMAYLSKRTVRRLRLSPPGPAEQEGAI